MWYLFRHLASKLLTDCFTLEGDAPYLAFPHPLPPLSLSSLGSPPMSNLAPSQSTRNPPKPPFTSPPSTSCRMFLHEYQHDAWLARYIPGTPIASEGIAISVISEWKIIFRHLGFSSYLIDIGYPYLSSLYGRLKQWRHKVRCSRLFFPFSQPTIVMSLRLLVNISFILGNQVSLNSPHVIRHVKMLVTDPKLRLVLPLHISHGPRPVEY
jgi:hypothetical protein